jgi:hypothetical protein
MVPLSVQDRNIFERKLADGEALREFEPDFKAGRTLTPVFSHADQIPYLGFFTSSDALLRYRKTSSYAGESPAREDDLVAKVRGRRRVAGRRTPRPLSMACT